MYDKIHYKKKKKKEVERQLREGKNICKPYTQ